MGLNERLIPVPTEYFFHRSIAMFSDKGINLIVDHVLHDRFTAADCFDTLENYNVLFVGVHCPIEELQRREIARGDRSVGQAISQLNYVHKNEIYDVEVDTFTETIQSCAERITEHLRSDRCKSAWLQTINGYRSSSK